MSETTQSVKEMADQVTQEQVLEQFKKQNPEDLAAAFFSMEQPKLKNLLDNLSQRQLKRLVFQLCSHPFTPKEYIATSDEEKRAFYLGDQMIHNRMIMQLSYEMQKAEDAVKQENEKVEEKDKTNETTTV